MPIEEQSKFFATTIRVNFPNLAWSQNNRTITGTCNETTGSGCRSNASTTYTTTTTLGTAGYVYDNAGNARLCDSSIVHIDKDNPYAPYLENIKPLENIKSINYTCQKNVPNSTTNNTCTVYIYPTRDMTESKFIVYIDRKDVGSGINQKLEYFTSNGQGADYCNWTEDCSSYFGIGATSATAIYKVTDYSGRTSPQLTLNYVVIY